jgi:L-threonylcarbamoyladenylate synthase
MPAPEVIKKAARIVLNGGVIAYPTEGVYGLGCLPDDWRAVDRLLTIKGRASKAGLILIAPDYELVAAWLAPTQQEYERITAANHASINAPVISPITWVVTAAPGTPDWLTGGRSTLAIRLTEHPIVARLCTEIGGAITSTSANRSGRPAARSSLTARRQLGRDLDFVLPGPLGNATGPSEIRMAQDNQVLRRAK